MLYASVWDFRFNHVPFSRGVGFGYGVRQSGVEGYRSAVATREVGWGPHEGHLFGGAPFDAVLPVEGVGEVGAAGAGEGARGRRFGGRRARSEDGGGGAAAHASGSAARRQVGCGLFRKGDENV